jgi:nucleoside-diphosphate-sugar epimerase
MRIFIFGATGVVGRRVIPMLLAQGHQVSAHGRSSAKRAALKQAGAMAVDLDIFSEQQVRAHVAGHDAVINLATAIPSSTRLLLPGAWRKNDQIRRIVSSHIVNAAIKENIGRVIQESFGLIYQDNSEAWIDETAPLQPARHTKSVLDAEGAVRKFTEAGGTGVVLRFALFYGPDSSQTIEMINFVRRGLAIMPKPEDGFISSISHDDAARAVVAALALPGGIYNVADDHPCSRRAFFHSLAQALGVKPPRLLPQWSKVLMGSVGETLGRSLRISNQKLRQASDWTPNLASVDQGWQSVVAQINGQSRGAKPSSGRFF